MTEQPTKANVDLLLLAIRSESQVTFSMPNTDKTLSFSQKQVQIIKSQLEKAAAILGLDKNHQAVCDFQLTVNNATVLGGLKDLTLNFTAEDNTLQTELTFADKDGLMLVCLKLSTVNSYFVQELKINMTLTELLQCVVSVPTEKYKHLLDDFSANQLRGLWNCYISHVARFEYPLYLTTKECVQQVCEKYFDGDLDEMINTKEIALGFFQHTYFTLNVDNYVVFYDNVFDMVTDELKQDMIEYLVKVNSQGIQNIFLPDFAHFFSEQKLNWFR